MLYVRRDVNFSTIKCEALAMFPILEAKVNGKVMNINVIMKGFSEWKLVSLALGKPVSC